MNYITTFYLIKILSLAGIISLSSCGSHDAPAYAPAPLSVYASESGTLNEHSRSTATRKIVKKAALNLDVAHVRQAGKQIETIVTKHKGHMTSMERRDDDSQHASYEIRVPAQHLVSTLDAMSELGDVTYRKISAEDSTRESIRQQARLRNLKSRQHRLTGLYRSATKISDKLALEKQLSEIESTIFEMEAAIKEMQKLAHFSRLSVEINRSAIRGPLGALSQSLKWSLSKLFTIRKHG